MGTGTVHLTSGASMPAMRMWIVFPFSSASRFEGSSFGSVRAGKGK